jgi:hypothetical protein
MFFDDDVVEWAPPDPHGHPGTGEVNHQGTLALMHLLVAGAIIEGPAWQTHVVPFRLNSVGIQMVRMLLAEDAIRHGPHWTRFLEVNPELRQEGA